jgi:UDP:flavonoid glycosyltransferase YjiC (YdhE family)
LDRYEITPPPANGLRPDWPSGNGPRIFAYLQSDPTSLPLIAALGRLGYPTIARIAGIRSSHELQSFKSIKIISEAIDVTHIAAHCDLAVLSGGHGTLAAILLAGKPVVIVPIQLEQLLLAKRCEESGFGIGSPSVDVRYFTNAVAKITTDSSYRTRARAFADRYRSFGPARQLQLLSDRIEDLAPSL